MIKRRFKESSQIFLGQTLECLQERLSAAAKELFIKNGCCADHLSALLFILL